MKQNDIILVGGGGHCKSAIDVILKAGVYNISGIVDVSKKIGQEVLGIPIIGSDEDLETLRKTYQCFGITIGQIESPALRIKVYEQLVSLDAFIPGISSPSSYISPFSKIGMGTMVFHHALINADAVIGNNCIINTFALIEHDVVIMDHCHISTGAIVNGNVVIEAGCFVGSNACIKQGVHIGPGAVIGAGSLVLKDVGAEEVVGGVPSKIFRKNA
jgi:sugar O-acyltransferase (sialic acid O-acetyltransferase NeuD family)